MWLVQFFIFSFFMSFLISSSYLFFGLPSGRVNIGFHLYTFFNILSSGIRCKWPELQFITFKCFMYLNMRQPPLHSAIFSKTYTQNIFKFLEDGLRITFNFIFR